ncbi:MAG: hypothetical protein GEV28_27970 [Actinophytocola sp.]|uniref:hypothetical protein n=1 Tax=Actinophytocola sp. TaxID=1872138 RepID=UPI001323726D|nr:hypothetical protein [Actinophytocola sp.]MPZ84024.1 hypothetical protein [Actinophytocola sp.]
MTAPTSTNAPMMTRSEVTRLLALCACYDQRTVGEADVAAWHTALAGATFAECETAIHAHVRTSRDRVQPFDILGRVRVARREAADRRAVLPTGLTDRAAADAARERGMAAVYAVMGWTHDNDRETALSVACPVPWCAAAPGVPCRRSVRRGGASEPRDPRTRVHPSRLDSARDHTDQAEQVDGEQVGGGA